ncbi:MAG TPA: carboxypeptidase regulatory-like domain-containing protein [Streptosporangiaceae bacterium]
MKHASRLRRLIALVAVTLTVVTSAFLASATAAGAATSTGQTTSAGASQAPDFVHACGAKMTKGRYNCFAMKRTNVKHSLMLGSGVTPAGYSPADIQSAYDLPSGSDSPLVAVVDAYDDPNAESDLAVYRAQYGLPACTTANGCFRKAGQDGGTDYPSPPPSGDDWVSEITLDLDAVSAACPSCHILLVEANDDSSTSGSLPAAVQTAYNMGAKFISMSWGGSEDGTENSQDAQYFDHPGIAYTASSGDYGYSAGPIYPSTSQYTVSVGGTTLNRATGTARGWSESAWSDAGSGCSSDVTKPQFQSGISACSTRADTDLSADADPNTGLAIYNTYSDAGWDVYGGTSLAAPLIASMYALAGTPAAGTFPASYPYNDQHQATDLNDVTSGSNGSCSPAVLCTAGPGWDGPTGLGSPEGTGALTSSPHGDIKGTVTDAGTGKPVAGATVSASGGYKATTDSSGGYDLGVPAGSYDLTVSDYSYENGTASGVQVTTGGSVTENFALTAEPTHTISGTVTDGSGHGWPMRAKITIDGYPGGPVYSSPYDGHYSVTLPDGAGYTLHVDPADLSGYTSQQATIDLAGADVTQDFALKVDPATCSAPGYAYHDSGATESFTGWQGATPQDGWTVTDNIGNGETWRFDDPSGYGPPPGGDADFAEIYSEGYGQGNKQDSSLVSPVVDLSDATSPEIGIDSTYIGFPGQTADVDLSLDGGTTWSTVWSPYSVNPGHQDIPIPQAAGQSDVRVRFHFTGSWGRRWDIDNVLIGDHTCAPVAGGLVAGVVKDANTGDPVNGVKVTSDSDPTQSGVTAATPDDPGLPDGYYWLFSSHTGTTGLTLTGGNYASTSAQATIEADAVTHADLSIDAGRLTVSKPSVSVSEVLGATATSSVTFGNSGTAPVNVSLSGQDAGFTAMGAAAPAAAPGAAPMVIKTSTSLAPEASGGAQAGAVRQSTPESPPWTDVANYPTAIMDDAVAEHDGKIYVVGGSNGDYALPDANVYDPATGSWSAIAPLPEPLNASSAGFIGDTLYVAGGWDRFGNPSPDVYAYDPGTDSWTQAASLPAGVAAAGSAVVSGKLYVIGGVGTSGATSAAAYSYDPGNNSWSQEPDYPAAVAFPACGGVDALAVCAGGSGASASTYVYAPGGSGWVKKSDMPDDAWGAATAAANGKLEVMGGAISNGSAVTNQGFAYDPASDTWSALPDSNNAVYRGGGACGIYQVGGSLGGFQPTQFTQNLPGYDQCGGQPAWLSLNTTGFDVQPGQTITVQITADSSVVAQPGSYAAQLVVSARTPYPTLTPVGVTMQVNPPKTWGKITGTVTGTSGSPIAGATIAICTMYSTQTGTCGPETFTLKTDGRGDYQLWLNHGFSPLEVIAAKDGYTPVMKIAKIEKGGTTTTDFTLSQSSAATQSTIQRFLAANERLRTG